MGRAPIGKVAGTAGGGEAAAVVVAAGVVELLAGAFGVLLSQAARSGRARSRLSVERRIGESGVVAIVSAGLRPICGAIVQGECRGVPVPQIYVDADACPVKDEVVRVAERHGLVVTFVANFGLRPSRDPMVRSVMVPQGADAADDWIVEQVDAGDLVVTSDIPLAGRALKKGATVIGPTGKPFTEQSIGMALAMRDLNQHLRETGESKGYNAGFTSRERSAFLQVFDAAVQRAKHKAG